MAWLWLWAMGIIQREFIIIKLTSVENINHQISLQFIRRIYFFRKKKNEISLFGNFMLDLSDKIINSDSMIHSLSKPAS